MELRESHISRVDVSTEELKKSVASMINPSPFVVYYGKDELIEKALTPRDTTTRLYRVGKVFSDSSLVLPLNTLRMFMFPLKISNLVVSIKGSWGISDGFMIRHIASKLDKDAICILTGDDVSELMLVAERLIHGFKLFKLLINDEYALILGYLER